MDITARSARPAFATALVVGGHGAVGRLVCELLTAAGTHVTVCDPADESTAIAGTAATATAAVLPTATVSGDIAAPAGELAVALGAADLVVLALPEVVILQAIPAVVPLLAPSALLVDTSSVKTDVVAALHRAGAVALSINPLFAPALGWQGQATAVVPVQSSPTEIGRGFTGAKIGSGFTDAKIGSGFTDPAIGDWFTDLLVAAGSTVVPLDADRHDRLMAAAQAATHAAVLAFGHALTELDVDPNELLSVAPPPCRALAAITARISSGSPHVYWDIQAMNPWAPTARRAVGAGLAAVDRVAAGPTPAAMGELLDRIATGLGFARQPLAETCREMFSDLRR